MSLVAFPLSDVDRPEGAEMPTAEQDFDVTKLLSVTNPRTGATLNTLGMTGRQVREWIAANGTAEDEWQCEFHPDVTLT